MLSWETAKQLKMRNLRSFAALRMTKADGPDSSLTLD